MSELRLGDIIDDFCVKCRRITNHSVVSIVNGGPAKVRCRTCHNDHDYRHEQAPPSKKELKKQELFNQVLGAVDPGAVDPAAAVVDPAVVDPAAADSDTANPDAAESQPEQEAEPAKGKKKKAKLS